MDSSYVMFSKECNIHVLACECNNYYQQQIKTSKLMFNLSFQMIINYIIIFLSVEGWIRQKSISISAFIWKVINLKENNDLLP